MYCKKCGTELREEDKFCYYCGRRTGVIQRALSSKAFVGSVIAVLVVAVAALLTYFIWTGKLNLSFSSQNQVSDSSNQGENGEEKPKEKEKAGSTPRL